MIKSSFDDHFYYMYSTLETFGMTDFQDHTRQLNYHSNGLWKKLREVDKSTTVGRVS